MNIQTTYIEKIRQQTIGGSELVVLLQEYQILPNLYRELLIDQAIEEVACSQEDIGQAIEQFYQSQNLQDGNQRQKWLQAKGMNQVQLIKQITRSLKIEKYKLMTWGNKLESHFLAQKPNLDRVVYSLLRTQEAGTAQELYFRIKAGEQSFAELAREYSQGIEAQTGGLIGPVVLSQPHPQLAAKLRSAKTGEILPPMRLGEWFVIARLEKMLPAQLDESTRKRLLDGLFQQWLNESVQALLIEQTSQSETQLSANSSKSI